MISLLLLTPKQLLMYTVRVYDWPNDRQVHTPQEDTRFFFTYYGYWRDRIFVGETFDSFYLQMISGSLLVVTQFYLPAIMSGSVDNLHKQCPPPRARPKHGWHEETTRLPRPVQLLSVVTLLLKGTRTDIIPIWFVYSHDKFALDREIHSLIGDANLVYVMNSSWMPAPFLWLYCGYL